MLNRKQRAFLSAYVQAGSLIGPERTAKVTRRSHYNWLQHVEYIAAFQQAEQELTDRLLVDVKLRAVRK